MSNPEQFFAAFQREVHRLGLDLAALPGGLAADVASLNDLLQHIRALTPPVTWRDVFPDMPAHWVEGQPETWTTPYRPFGVYDHQSLPTGPAIHVQWPRASDPRCLDRLMDAARAAAWPVHGGGFLDVGDSDWPTLDAIIVLDAGTDADQLDGFLEWLGRRSDVAVAAIPRRSDEHFI